MVETEDTLIDDNRYGKEEIRELLDCAIAELAYELRGCEGANVSTQVYLVLGEIKMLGEILYLIEKGNVVK